MAHWLDRLADHSVRDEDTLSRRAVLKAGGAGVVAGTVLGSASLAQASDGIADLLRESACRCHQRADNRYDRAMGNYIDGIFTRDPTGVGLYFFNFAALGVDSVALAGIAVGYTARKLSCGTCKRSESGDNKPAPPSNQPGQIVPGVSGCPENTVGCAMSTTCCFAGDICCPCRGDFICCIQAVGCACC